MLSPAASERYAERVLALVSTLAANLLGTE
jgi:hypothetical protein